MLYSLGGETIYSNPFSFGTTYTSNSLSFVPYCYIKAGMSLEAKLVDVLKAFL